MIFIEANISILANMIITFLIDPAEFAKKNYP